MNMKNMYLLKNALATYQTLGLHYSLPVCLGIDETGKEHFADLVNLKHILMTGSTGSGKSIFEHSLITTLGSLVPSNELKLLLIDMKRVDLTTYAGLPQLLTKPLVSSSDVFTQLKLLILEQQKRLSQNRKLPYIVVIIDTFSDLMCESPVEFEQVIGQLTKNSAKTGIHLVLSDSRSSHDLYTPSLLSFFPTKLCFNVTSETDSKLFLGASGGEKLKGVGDMLLQRNGQSRLLHLQAPHISDKEVTGFVSKAKGKTEYDVGFAKNGSNPLLCKAFIIDLLGKRYMLHIWLKPYFSIGWHRKHDGRTGKLFWIEKYN